MSGRRELVGRSLFWRFEWVYNACGCMTRVLGVDKESQGLKQEGCFLGLSDRTVEYAPFDKRLLINLADHLPTIQVRGH